MPRARAVLATLLCAAGLVAAGCSSSQDYSFTPSTGTPQVTIPGITDSAVPTDPAGRLLQQLTKGIDRLGTAHITLDTRLDDKTGHAVGVEKFANGTPIALDVTYTIGKNGSFRVVLAGGSVFVKLPKVLRTSPKQWSLVTTTSSNAVVQELASSLSYVQTAASLSAFVSYARAATHVTDHGSEKVNGVEATHYSGDVVIARLPRSMPGMSTLTNAGKDTFDADFWLDAKGYPVKLSDSLNVKGQRVSATIALSEFNKPVHISEPPADQVDAS